MTNYNDGNEDGKDNGNDASGSGSDGPIFDTKLRRLSLVEEDLVTDDGGATDAAHYVYKLSKMCHRLMYEKFGVFD